MKNKILYIFLIVCVGELLGVALDIEFLQWICKPLIMVTLGIYYYLSTVTDKSWLSKPVLGAIIFSFGGDVALMFQTRDEIFFILGLASFLVAHICYILSYNQHKVGADGKGLAGIQKFRFALPFVLAGTGLITILYPHLGGLKIPVMIYALVIVIMVLQAIFRFGYTSNQSFWSVFVGAVLFMISDSLIAINKFLSNFELAGLMVMSTYMLAQFLIIRGLIIHHKKEEYKKAN